MTGLRAAAAATGVEQEHHGARPRAQGLADDRRGRTPSDEDARVAMNPGAMWRTVSVAAVFGCTKRDGSDKMGCNVWTGERPVSEGFGTEGG